METWIAVLIGSATLLCVAICIFFCIQVLYTNKVRSMYEQAFHHPPDDISLERWRRRWYKNGLYELRQYIDRVHVSREACRRETIIFTGLCQNHGHNVIRFWLPILEKWGSEFHDYRVLIMENDSTDGTRQLLLQEARRNPKMLVLCDDDTPLNIQNCSLGVSSSPDKQSKEKDLARRLHVLATLRDNYMNRINRKWSHYTHLVVIDWDLVGDLSEEGFFDSLQYLRDNKADGVAVNSYHYTKKHHWRFFDTFPLLNHHRCVAIHRDKVRLDKDTCDRLTKRLLYNEIHPFRVESAFGGICIYNMASVIQRDASYVRPPPGTKKCDIQCEHSTFNQNLQIIINPRFQFLIVRNFH